MEYYLCSGENSLIFSEDNVLDSYLIKQIEHRLQETNADALILGQGPVLSLGFIDPRTGQCDCPGPGVFAVKKDAAVKVGDADESLSSAWAADYLYRLRQKGCRCSLALDIYMPCTAELPVDITDLWVDSLLLDYKHGNSTLRKQVLKKVFRAFRHYDPSIGNYSRKKLVKAMPSFVKNVIRYSFYRGKETSSLRFFESSSLRGSYRMEVRRPNHQPLVSIVIRTYKKKESLRKTLESLRWLDYKNIEIIVVEDGLPDSEEMIRRDFSDLPIRYHATIENRGRAAAANTGFSLANGEWINMLDDDDYLFPEHLSAAISEAETTGSDLVFLQSVAMEVSPCTSEPAGYTIDRLHRMDLPRIDPFTMSGSCVTANNGVLFRSKLLDNGIKMREDLGANEDWELWLQLMKRGTWTRLPYATCAFVNAASSQEKVLRDDRYKQWKGLQFDSPNLCFKTSGAQLARYYLGVLNDVQALLAAGNLETFCENGAARCHNWSSEELEKGYKDFCDAVTRGESGIYSGKEFNKWYWSVFEHFLATPLEKREKEAILALEKELKAYPTKEIRFIGFWPWFKKDDNFFLDALDTKYRINQTGEDPDYIISSIFGYGFYEYVRYDGVRIFFSGENYAPDLNLVDYAMSYNPIYYPERYLRIPEYFVDIRRIRNRLLDRLSYEEALKILESKTEFCNFIYGDSKCCEQREGIFRALDNRKKVLSAGSWINNTDNGFRASMLSTKDEVQSRCRFTIAVESCVMDGFVTEKLTDAFLNNTIPIYYGDPSVEKVFNPKAFINARNYNSYDELADEILCLDSSPEEMAKILSEPVFLNEHYLDDLENEFEDFLFKIFDQNREAALKRPQNGQPEVHQHHMADLQRTLQELEKKKYR